ncbi:hypothetical protein U1Q18_051577 [Sarracenia purpurea var. burkii]
MSRSGHSGAISDDMPSAGTSLANHGRPPSKTDALQRIELPGDSRRGVCADKARTAVALERLHGVAAHNALEQPVEPEPVVVALDLDALVVGQRHAAGGDLRGHGQQCALKVAFGFGERDFGVDLEKEEPEQRNVRGKPVVVVAVAPG